jgi:hypothetical protein
MIIGGYFVDMAALMAIRRTNGQLVQHYEYDNDLNC